MSGPGLGQDLSGDQIAALNAANNPSESNPVATISDVAGAASYIHTQAIPATIWTVNHGLNRRVSVSVVDLSDQAIVAQITWIDDNTVQIDTNSPAAGYVYCN
jgi:hypothetical protein